MKKGDCIIKACENVIDKSNWLFCYAYVMGQGDLAGQRILHAWNEEGDVVFDTSNGNNVVMRKEQYYKMAQITEDQVTKQTPDEVRKLMLETGTYGGWIKVKEEICKDCGDQLGYRTKDLFTEKFLKLGICMRCFRIREHHKDPESVYKLPIKDYIKEQKISRKKNNWRQE